MMCGRLKPVVCIDIILLFVSGVWGKVMHPVICVPGYGGSQLKATIDEKQTSVNSFCSKKDSNFTIWIDIGPALELIELSENTYGKCWVDNMKLTYDPETRKTFNTQGVKLHVDFGRTEAVEYILDTETTKILKFTPFKYFLKYAELYKDMCDALEKKGFVRNKSIRGAPYDFRKGPNENEECNTNMKALIEETYTDNGNKSCILVVHSMGGPKTLNFLQSQTKEWKQKHVDKLVTCGANWGGSMLPMKIYTEGDDLGAPIAPETIRSVLVTCPATAWQCPRKEYWGNRVLVSTPEKNYSLGNMNKFFDDLRLPDAHEMWLDAVENTDDSPPGVEVHCLYGTNVSTLAGIRYSKNLTERGTASYDYEDGDGTVTLKCLQVNPEWRSSQEQKIIEKPFPGVKHGDIIKNKDVIDHILKLATET